eukprot:COSAG01_NODE_47546_length_389_cov_0.934483_1_plen_93_part_01
MMLAEPVSGGTADPRASVEQPLAAGVSQQQQMRGGGGAAEQARQFWAELGRSGTRHQFVLAAGLAAGCGLVNKLQMFPMNFIAGPSQCHASLS